MITNAVWCDVFCSLLFISVGESGATQMDFVPLFYLFVHLRLYSQLIFEYSRKPFQSKKYSQMWKKATRQVSRCLYEPVFCPEKQLSIHISKTYPSNNETNRNLSFGWTRFITLLFCANRKDTCNGIKLIV